MAFSGFHVSLHRLDGSRNDPSEYLPIYGELSLSETLATAGTTTLAVPANGVKYLARISVSVPSWITIGSTPADPTLTSSARFYHDASFTYDIVVKQGDKFSWSLA